MHPRTAVQRLLPPSYNSTPGGEGGGKQYANWLHVRGSMRDCCGCGIMGVIGRHCLFSLAYIAYRKSVSAVRSPQFPCVYNAGFRKITQNLPKILGLSASVFMNYRSKYLRKKNTVGGSDLICVECRALGGRAWANMSTYTTCCVSLHQWTGGPVHQRTSGTVNQWTSEQLHHAVNHQTSASVNLLNSGPADESRHQWTGWNVNQWINGQVHQLTSWPVDQWTTAPVNLCEPLHQWTSREVYPSELVASRP